MSPHKTAQVDLAKLFNTVSRALKENQAALNAADEVNHNHGDNMVSNFQTITWAMKETKDCTPTEQLMHASQVLSQRSQTGSAQLYAQGLSNAAEQMRGQASITPENAMLLVQSLLGSGSQAQAPEAQTRAGGMEDLLGGLLGGQQGSGGTADLLGSLLGGQTAGQPGQPDAGDLLGSLMGGQTTGQQGQPQAGDDMLSTLLGGLMGGQPTAQPQQGQPAQGGGIDLNTLLTAGMAFFQARQQGAQPVQALVQAVMAGSQMMGSASHTQSGQLVAQTMISTLGTMLSGKK